MTFQVKIESQWTTPPLDARPVSVGSDIMPLAPVVRWREPAGRDGYGRPVAASSEMYATIGRPSINSSGLNWWYTNVGLSNNLSTSIEVKLFNPVTQQWTAYRGLAWRPTYSGGRAGNKVTDFTITITNLEAI